MIAAWMLEATVVALLLAGGAAAAQRVLGLYRGTGLRWPWAGAIAGTLAASVLWLVPGALHGAGSAASTAAVSRTAVIPTAPFYLPPVPASVEHALVAGWAVASMLLAAVLALSFVRLMRERRACEDGVVAGARVSVSESLGPAAVGLWRPRVVIPRWVLSLAEPAQRAIVAHEAEHQRRRDPALLIAGLAAVVLMPWNVGLWLAWRGLRLAVEFDCDERVLARGVERGDYAELLLGTLEHTRSSWLPTAAFTRPSGLGARVEHMLRPRPRRRAMKVALGTLAAAALVVAACDAPAPSRIVKPSARTVATQVAPAKAGPLFIIDGVQQTNVQVTPQGQLAGLSPDRIKSIEVLKGQKATEEYGPKGLNGVIIVQTK